MKIINPTLPSGYVIFCDDIREEVNGKTTFVGAYSGEMTVFGIAPARVAKLCVHAAIRIDPNSLPLHLRLEIVRKGESGVEILFGSEAELPAEAAQLSLSDKPTAGDAFRFLEVSLSQQFAGVEFTEDCTINVRAIIADEEYRLGTLNVKLAQLQEVAAA